MSVLNKIADYNKSKINQIASKFMNVNGENNGGDKKEGSKFKQNFQKFGSVQLNNFK